jgi:CPA2 family monovalent cation:H+ antiporter-2
VVVVGYGPVGQTLCRILRANGLEPVVIEMNMDTVQRLRNENIYAIYGDAAQMEILLHAGVKEAEGLIIAASSVPYAGVVKAARELNPDIRIVTRSIYLKEAKELHKAGADAVFSSEGETAIAMATYLMRELGAGNDQIDRERDRIHEELFSS